MADFHLKRGYDLPLAGAAEKKVELAPPPERVALDARHFRGAKLRPAVAEGDTVARGAPLFRGKDDETLVVPAPASGQVVAVARGARRLLQTIEIAPDGKDTAVEFRRYEAAQLSGLPREEALAHLRAGGLLACFRQRPFGYVADAAVVPRDIFISAMDTAPLAPDETLLLAGNEAAFQAGLDVCSRLTPGKVHLSINGARRDLPAALSGARNVQLHRFSGPHPAGLVGVQIHHLAPIRARRDVVWTIALQHVILIGRLFLTGRFDPRVVVAVTGSAAPKRVHYQTVLGAPLKTLAAGAPTDGQVRYISGNVLTGENVGPGGFLGFHEQQVTLIPEARESEFMGWLTPGLGKLSRSRSFLSAWLPGQRFAPDTRLNGGLRAFVATGYYEQVLPMDVLPLFLFKSILAEDFVQMEGLGLYEVIEEDVALCEFACPSKVQLQKLIRRGLDLIEAEG